MANSALAPTMIGRRQQLAVLHAALTRTRAGVGQVVLLAGEAGVGKTRLLREFVREATDLGAVSIFTGHCYDERPAPPYGPFTELLRRLGDEPDQDLGELRRALSSLAMAADGSGDPHAERRMLFQAIYQALRPHPGEVRVLLLEDLHWADQASQDLLLYLARAAEADRLLIVGSYRTDEMHRLHPLAGLIASLSRDRRHDEIRLAPLSRDELAEMLAATLRDDPPAGLVTALYERTEGNPFFAEEILGTLMAAGEKPGAYLARPALSDAAMPLSIKDSVLRRAADLDEPTRAALSAAAVIGRRFDFELLLRLTGTAEAPLLRSLSALIERQLVVEEQGGPEDRYSFRHELIRAVFYEEMLRRERRLRHQEVLRALEELHAADLDAAVDQLAYHALMARALPEAARYSERAGDRAVRVHAYREALGHYEAALEASEGDADESHRAGLLTRLGHAAYLVGEPRRAAGAWREALPVYEALGDRRRAADLQRWLGRCAWELGDAAGAFAQTRAALATLAGEPPCRELAMACSALSHLYMLQTHDEVMNAQEAISWGERALVMGEALGDEQVITHALNNIGVATIESGRTAEGLAHLERSLAVALAADLPADAVRAYINFGSRLAKVGGRRRSIKLLREGWAYAARHGYIRGSGKLLYLRCYNELEAGELDAAEAGLAEGLRPGFAAVMDDRPLLLMLQAILHGVRGRYAEARTMAETLIPTLTDDDDCSTLEHLLLLIYQAEGDRATMVAMAERLMARARARIGPEAPLTALGQRIFKLTGPAEIFLEAGRRAEALAIIAAQEAVLPPGEHHLLERGLLAELQGLAARDESPAAAADHFARAAHYYEAAVCALDVARACCRRAEALLLMGARAEAETELRAARALAEPAGAIHELARITTVEARLIPPRPAPQPQQQRPVDGLTPRELEVLALITRGLSNRAIAETLVISEKTAEVHVRNILGKLGFTSRTQAATYAVERGLVARSA